MELKKVKSDSNWLIRVMYFLCDKQNIYDQWFYLLVNVAYIILRSILLECLQILSSVITFRDVFSTKSKIYDRTFLPK